VPFMAHEYNGGRSLRYIVDRARGGNGGAPNPMPIDQAIHIAERGAPSLATLAALRPHGRPPGPGAVVPPFILVREGGGSCVGGQQWGRGLIASLKDGKLATAVGRYFSPEYVHSGEPTQTSEVFAMGAILFLLVTGNDAPDAAHVSAFSQHVRGTKTM